MKPALRKELFERYKEIRSGVLFNQFVRGMENGNLHVRYHPYGELWTAKDWTKEFSICEVMDTIYGKFQ